jgi:hypothetical protein
MAQGMLLLMLSGTHVGATISFRRWRGSGLPTNRPSFCRASGDDFSWCGEVESLNAVARLRCGT